MGLKRFWRALFHDEEDKERSFCNCSDPCKTGRNLEPNPTQSKSTATAETVLLFSTACAALSGERKHVAATSREHPACYFHHNTAKGRT